MLIFSRFRALILFVAGKVKANHGNFHKSRTTFRNLNFRFNSPQSIKTKTVAATDNISSCNGLLRFSLPLSCRVLWYLSTQKVRRESIVHLFRHSTYS